MPDQIAADPPAQRSEQISALQAIAELARIDFARHNLQGVLGQVAELARTALVSGGEVSVTLLRGAEAYTAAFTGQPALSLDEAQYLNGAGPCLDAAIAGEDLLIEDMTGESRWPPFTANCLRAGIASSLALTLPVQDGITGALNLYSRTPQGFDDDALDLGRTFAAYAAVAVGNARLYNDAATQARQMREAMEHRAIIEQAKGILIAQRRCTPEEAFEILRERSNTSNRKLRDVAALLVSEAARAPDLGVGS